KPSSKEPWSVRKLVRTQFVWSGDANSRTQVARVRFLWGCWLRSGGVSVEEAFLKEVEKDAAATGLIDQAYEDWNVFESLVERYAGKHTLVRHLHALRACVVMPFDLKDGRLTERRSAVATALQS
ncbi:MAG: hypothetical protein AAF353_20370, partial [Pseudomonadota bacterium]